MTVESPFLVIPWESEPRPQFVERASAPSDAIRDGLAEHPWMVISGSPGSWKS